MPKFSSENPLVSVIIPAYNAARYLDETLDSVRAQSYRSFEIIVIDDGSTDDTAGVAQSQGDVRYERQENLGSGIARNWGVAMACGEMVSFVDADDLWSADKLTKQIEFYRILPDEELPTLVYGHVRQFFSPELEPQSYANISLPAHPQKAFLPGTLLMKRAEFDFIGPYSNRLAEGVDWHLRAVDKGAHVHVMPDVLLSRRIHLNNMGRTQNLDKREYARSVKAALDRRRAQAAAQKHAAR